MSKRLRAFVFLAMVLGVAASGHRLFGQATPVADEFASLHFRSIGPAQASGRVADLAVYEANPAIFWVGAAHGGVWKTTNNGATFTPQFQHNGSMSVGDLAVSQKNPDLVWMGTGEPNNRQSTGWGDGVYKSTDGGTTWKLMGLPTSRHIGRIVIDPVDDNIVLVAALGSLWGPGGERGVYKTTDGGATWKAVLTVDENTGANDLVMAASDRRTLYASMYQRQRSQCCMNGGGPGSGIYKSTDGGDTWTKLTNGLPTVTLGRIALDVYRASANIVYAEVQAEGAGGGRGAGGAPGGGVPGGGAAAAGAGGGRGAGGRAGGAAGAGAGAGAGAAQAGAAAAPPAAPAAEGIYRSDDGGASWRRTGNNPDGRAMYFSQIRIDPNSPDRLLVASVRMSMSTDGGRSFLPVDQPVHDDKHAIWWDPANSNHVIIGTDGGVYQTWDGTRTWMWSPNLSLATFYHVWYDLEYPYNVCGGMQDNYNWCGPSAVRTANGITNDRWHQIQGGDGFVAIPDARDWRVVYTESQDGNISRRNRLTGESKGIRPTPANTTDANPSGGYRFHWDTPLQFSATDPGTLLAAGNKLFKSSDRGDSWTAISPDLTTNPVRADQVIMGVKASDVRIANNDGIAAWPTIVTVGESPRQPGVYYAGTDDGVVSVTRDGGAKWDKTLADRMPGFVKGGYVSETVASRFDAGTVYVTQDAHRLNDFDTHIWVSNDFGTTFRSLNGNLKGEVVHSITEDLKNPDVLYLSTESGIFLTIDRGKSWRRLSGRNFPNVRVDEITIHPRENALLVATHGRGIWILDHLEPIQEYAQARAAEADVKLFSIPPALQWRQWDDRNEEFWGHQFWVGENPTTQAVIQLHVKKAPTDVRLKITDALGKQVREIAVPSDRLQAGIQTVCWDMRVDPIAAGGGAPAGAGAGAAAAAAAARAGGAGPGGGRGGAGVPQPAAGYMPSNPCGGAGGFGGGRGGGGGATAGPMVLPGTYNVALIVGGKAIDTKPLRIVGDPALQADAGRKRATEIAMDLHEIQKRGQQTADALTSIEGQMADVSAKVKASSAPDAVKAQFDAFVKEFDATKAKFGISAAPAGGARGAGPGGAAGGGFGGRGGAAPDPQNVLGRAGALKGDLVGFGDLVSDTQLKQYNELKLAVPKAVTDANAVIVKAMALSQTLKKHDIALTVPAPVK